MESVGCKRREDNNDDEAGEETDSDFELGRVVFADSDFLLNSPVAYSFKAFFEFLFFLLDLVHGDVQVCHFSFDPVLFQLCKTLL